MDSVRPDFHFSEELTKKFKSKKNIKQLAVNILTLIRGIRSQEYMNRKLGYTFNQYAKWESGNKTILWNDVLNVSQIQKLDIVTGLSVRFSFSSAKKLKSGKHILEFFSKNFFKSSTKEFAAYLGIKPPVLRRLLQNEKDIPFEIILCLFLYRPMFLLYFLRDLKILDQLVELKSEFSRLESLELLESEYPFCSMILYYTDTTEYMNAKIHNPEKMANDLGLTLKQVTFSIEELEKRNLIIFKDKKYHPNLLATELHSLSLEQIIRIMTFWNFRSLSYLQNKKNNRIKNKSKNHVSFRVFSAPKSVAEKISDKLVQTYYEINQMLKEADNTTNEETLIKVLTINYFGIEDSHPVEFIHHPQLGLVEKMKD